MTSRHLVDPELVAGLAQLPVLDLTTDALAAMNRSMNDMMANMPPAGPAGTVEERRIAGASGTEVTVVIHRPAGTPPAETMPAVIHMHGGGYVLGSARLMLAGVQRMAVAANCVVISVDYRLAPATPYPGPLEDCYTALKWAFDHAATLGIDPARIAVAGESAGGGLAAALALLARDRGEVPVIHQHLIFPMIDDRTGTGDLHPYTGEFVWTAASNRFAWSAYLGQAAGSDGVSAYAAPARATDLAGLPPAFLYVGTLDLFLEEDVEYARRLIRAGVPTELHVFPGAYHGFGVAPEADVTQRAQAASEAALRRALHPATVG